MPQERMEDIIEKIWKNFDIKEYNYRSYKIILCYFIWKVKTDGSIKNANDLIEIISEDERVAFAAMLFDELAEHFVENRSHWELLNQLADEYDANELAACVLYAGSYDEQYYEDIPDGIVALIDKLADKENANKILQLNFSNYGYVLNRGNNDSKTEYTAYTDDYCLSSEAYMRADILGVHNIVLSDQINDDMDYDVAFVRGYVDPTKVMSRSEASACLEDEWDVFPRENSEIWNLIGWAIKSIKDDGKVVATLNGGQLTVRQTEKVRKFLVEGGYIDTVIMLPNKVYANTWINPYVLVLKKGSKNVKFIDASSYYTSGRIRGKRINVIGESEIEAILNACKAAAEVSLEEIASNDYILSPSRYLSNNTNVNDTVELGSLLRGVSRGMTLSAAKMDELLSEEEGDTKCIITSSIFEGVVDTNLYYRGELSQTNKNMASLNNVLLSKTGNPFKVAMTNGKYLVVGNVYILDIDTSKVSAAYIRCFLASAAGQAEITRLSVGPTTKIISVENLKKIRIPIYEDSKQLELNQRADELVKELENSYQQMKNAKEEIDSIF